jgi:DNA-binding transcriptional MerR regulator
MADMARHAPSHSYTVSQLAELSGVTVRTLHHYDAIGLLRPANVGANGYRYYGRAELLRLQQILFNRELGLSLRRIRELLDAPGYDRARALREQRTRLVVHLERLNQLIHTLDETLEELEGGEVVDDVAIYRGFSAEIRARSDAWAVARYGEAARHGIASRERVTRSWSEADWNRHSAASIVLYREFADALRRGLGAESDAAQAVARKFHANASALWPGLISRSRLIDLADTFSEIPEIQAELGRLAPGLAGYVAEAMRVFASAAAIREKREEEQW